MRAVIPGACALRSPCEVGYRVCARDLRVCDVIYFLATLNGIRNFFTVTLAIDDETDAVIQPTLRPKLGSDATLFVIAHRPH